MGLFSSTLIRAHGEPPTIMRTRTAVVANLALWDPAVATTFSNAPLHEVFDPMDRLRELASERGWTSNSPAFEPCWESGSHDVVGGCQQVHSALLAATGDVDEIETRVWKGQVGTLFPYLEERRRDLIDRYGHLIRLPITTYDGRTIADRYDLELGHLRWQLQQSAAGPHRSILRGMAKLVKMRNALAHFEVVPASLLLDNELLTF
jgi:hypothetical protein